MSKGQTKGLDINFAVSETTKIMEENWYRGAEYYPNAEMNFITDIITTYKHFQSYRTMRGVLQIRYICYNLQGLGQPHPKRRKIIPKPTPDDPKSYRQLSRSPRTCRYSWHKVPGQKIRMG